MRKIAFSILFGILFTISLIYNPTSILININALRSSINGYGIFIAISTLTISYAFYHLFYRSHYKIKYNIHIFLTSVFLSVCLLLGKYYTCSLTLQDMFKDELVVLINFVMFLVFFVSFYIILINLFEYLNSNHQQNLKSNNKSEEKKTNFSKILDFVFEKHSLIVPFLIILICGLPYIIYFYPGTVQQDGNFQLQQFLGNYERTSHHPFVSTIILGTFFKIGSYFGNDNLGIFTFTFLQFLFSSFVFTYTINFMKKIEAPITLRFLTLVYFSCFTIWPINSYTFVKDTLYYLIFLLIVIKIFQYVISKENRNDLDFSVCLALLCIALCFFRNNGIEVVFLSIISLLFFDKDKKRLTILIYALTIVLIYNYLIQPFIYNKLEIKKGSLKEALSVPIQQISLTVIRHKNEIAEKDKAFIEEIYNISFDQIKEQYNPEISDPIKYFFNDYLTNQQLKDFIKIWFKFLVKYPITYIDAYCNNYYGYFYPDRIEYKDGLGWYQCSSTEEINVHFNPNFVTQRNAIKQFAYFVRNLPLIGLFYSTGIYSWFLIIIFTYLMYNKKYKHILILIPSILSLAVCILSPVNAYIRYSQPIMASMPILLCLLFYKKSKKK